MLQLRFIYDGAASTRFHTCDTIRSQNIAEHSFGVAWCCELLTRGTASKNLIMAALAHDLAEHVVGDIPSPSKRAMQISDLFHDTEMKHLRIAGLAAYDDELMEGERYTLKVADMLDGMMFCIRERKLGNLDMELVYSRFYTYACEVWQNARKDVNAQDCLFSEYAFDNLICYIQAQWRKYNESGK